VSDYIRLLIWVAVIGGAFAYTWRKGHLRRLADYVKETREELRKCTWPTMDELKGSTVVVMISIVLLGGLTVAVDLVATVLVRFIS
jgi:preprotein translocase subunit SecE